ncbi:MAG: hypothetical protein QXJ06_00395 [Candidatus Aenigmatarchaeota archaeon]
MKGVTKSIIISLIFLIVIIFFLVLAFTIFKERTEQMGDVFRNLFKQALANET